MKKINFDSRKKPDKKFLLNTKKPRARPRAYEEELILSYLDYCRVKKAYESGTLVKTGPRRIKWN